MLCSTYGLGISSKSFQSTEQTNSVVSVTYETEGAGQGRWIDREIYSEKVPSVCKISAVVASQSPCWSSEQ